MNYINLHKKQIYYGLVALFFLVIAYAFCLPMLKEIYLSSRGDWDYYSFLYEVPSISIFEYGQFPLWNPYCGGGIPLFGNPQVGFLSLSFLMTSIFGVFAGLKISVWLHTFLGLWGMWLLGTQMGVRGPARLVPPFVFMFSSSWALRLTEGHINWLVAAYLPFLLLTFLKGLEIKRWLLVAAIVESMMFYQGGAYIFAYCILFVCVYAASYSMEIKSWKPIFACIIVNLVAAGLSAPKLFPVLTLLVSNPRLMPLGEAIRWDNYLAGFLERNDSLGHSSEWEYYSYTGLTVVVFYLGSLSLYKKQQALILSSLFMLLVSLGNFGTYSPWALMHKLPFWRYFQIPTRSLIVFIFTVALTVGIYMGRPSKNHYILRHILIGVIVLFIGIDLFLVGSKIFTEVNIPVEQSFLYRDYKFVRVPAKPFKITPDMITGIGRHVASVHQPFSQIRYTTYGKFIHGAYSDQYLPLLQNKGFVDAYETIPYKRYAYAVLDKGYRGEFYLLKKGVASLLKWSPNKFVYHVKLQEANRLVINQNYWTGWHASQGTLSNFFGLLAVDLPPGEYDVAVYYLPLPFLIGLAVFFATITGSLVFCLRRRFQPVPKLSPNWLN